MSALGYMEDITMQDNTMKRAVVLLMVALSIFSYSVKAQTKSAFTFPDSVIVWNSSYKLTFKDFESRHRVSNSYAGAMCGIRYKSIFIGDSVSIIIYSFFNKRQSFIQVDDSILIEHEQLHFNIAEKYARLFRRDILAILKNGKVSLEKLQDAMDKKLMMYSAECDKEQDRYDAETNHSINTKQQVAWCNHICTELKQLKDVSDMYLSGRVSFKPKGGVKR